jgi:hypothetical protein
MAATSIWGHREYGIANEVAQHPGSWDRRIIRIRDGGPAEIDEMGFWVTWRGDTNDIRAWDGAIPRELRAAVIARFRDPEIRVWNESVTERWRDAWLEPGTLGRDRPRAVYVCHENRTVLCQARTVEELHGRIRKSLSIPAPFDLEQDGQRVEELRGRATVWVVLHGDEHPTPVFVQTEEGRTMTFGAY